MKYYILSVDSGDITLTLADSLKNFNLSISTTYIEDLLGVLVTGDVVVIKRDVPADVANIVLRKEDGQNEYRKILEVEKGANITDFIDGQLGSDLLIEISADKYKQIIKRMLESMEITVSSEAPSESAVGITGGTNDLYYGVPGSGKSHTIDGLIKGAKYERVVFHPDYSYSDFVGQIMPRLITNDEGKEKLSYVFVPGPFTNAVKSAVNNSNEMMYLIIEEINRGNAPAIFGDVFQLLDREEDGTGKYSITNYDIAKEIYGADNADKPIRLPANLTILATMNTSDQNVFTLDTAFQRRWNMKYIANNVKDADHASSFIDDRKEITWGDFAFFVNNAIVEYNAEMSSTEDKQLGAYFVQKGDLNRAQFAEKALKYLWDDVYRMERYEFFDSRIKSIGDLIDTYKSADKEPLKRVMKADVYRRMMDMTANSPADAVDESEVFEAEPVSDN